MSQKPIIWLFTSKDLVSYTILVMTLTGLYYGMDKRLDAMELKKEAVDNMQDYRIGKLEDNSSNKTAYEIPKEAVLPQSPRIKKHPVLVDIN